MTKKSREMIPEEEVERKLKEHGWMISRRRAEAFAFGGNDNALIKFSVSDVLSGKAECGRIPNLEGRVERVLGKFSAGKGIGSTFRRSLMLGDAENTVTVTLWGVYSDVVDTIPVHRGDRIEIKNLVLYKDESGYGMESTNGTAITKTFEGSSRITDFSALECENMEIDICGEVVDVGNQEFGRNKIGYESRSLTISDGKTEAQLTVWRSLCNCIEVARKGSIIIAESVSVKKGNGNIEINAGSGSRILILDNIQ